MVQGEAGRSGLWTWANIALILFSTANILHPRVRHAGAFQIAYLALLVVYFFLMIRRLKADGTGDVPLGKLHDEVKRGRRLPKSTPLEIAAVVALMLSSYFSR
jgi:hypothetical protein